MIYGKPAINAIVVESYSTSFNQQMVIARFQEVTGYLFISTNLVPQVDFADKISFCPETGSVYVCRGNSHLTFKLTTHPVPADEFLILLENRPTA